jgi:glycosyltransferase involved in cell wall biosynthesis
MHVVWFAEIKWDYLRTRKQQLIRRRPSDIDLVFFEPYARGRENRYRLRDVDGIRVATVPFVKAIPRGPLRGALDLALARRLVDAAAVRRVRGHLRAAGVRPSDTTFVVSNVYAIHAARSLGPRRLVYDCNDAHADFPGLPRWTRAYQQETFRRADRVVVSSRALRDEAVRARGGNRDVHLVGNGVDFAAFRRALASAPAEPGPADARVGYLGAIAPWFDFDLVAEMARARPQWRFALVGPVLGGAEADAARLASLANVELHPAVPHDDVPGVLRGFSVGMIPFRRTRLTAGVNPNKLYEYLAAGLPTVATPFSPEVEEDARVVSLARDAGAFIRACEAFLSVRADAVAREAMERRALEIAAGHDWDRIAAGFWALLRD